MNTTLICQNQKESNGKTKLWEGRAGLLRKRKCLWVKGWFRRYGSTIRSR